MWGATAITTDYLNREEYFNPRSRVGSDPKYPAQSSSTLYFNPRSRVGSDSSFGRGKRHPIHFNPRSRVGSDDFQRRKIGLVSLFQSTLPCGERRISLTNVLAGKDFNPRSRVGSDITLITYEEHQDISIHAPVWGATIKTINHSPRSWISIHAPVWGATTDYRNCHFQRLFQSTLPCGERPPCRAGCRLRLHFNPRSRVGSDAGICAEDCQAAISIHAPVWGATKA